MDLLKRCPLEFMLAIFFLDILLMKKYFQADSRILVSHSKSGAGEAGCMGLLAFYYHYSTFSVLFDIIICLEYGQIRDSSHSLKITQK